MPPGNRRHCHKYVMSLKEKFTKIYKDILFYLSVPKCVGCKTRLSRTDDTLCRKCTKEYKNIKTNHCSICYKPLYECSCTNQYLKAHHVSKLIKIFRYVRRDPLPNNNLIYSLKRDNRKDVLEFLSNELAQAIKASIKNPEEYIFTNVPRRRESAKKYGLDHAAALSRSLAKKFGAEYKSLLTSKAKRAQKKMSGNDRASNAKFVIKKNAEDLGKKNVILVDDIVTTGASMGNSAILISSLTKGKIVGAAISIAYKDPYTPLDSSDRFTNRKG